MWPNKVFSPGQARVFSGASPPQLSLGFHFLLAQITSHPQPTIHMLSTPPLAHTHTWERVKWPHGYPFGSGFNFAKVRCVPELTCRLNVSVSPFLPSYFPFSSLYSSANFLLNTVSASYCHVTSYHKFRGLFIIKMLSVYRSGTWT